MAEVGDTPGGRLEPSGDRGLVIGEIGGEITIILQDQHALMAGVAGDIEERRCVIENIRDNPGVGKPTAVFGSIAGNQISFGPSGSQPTRRNSPRISPRRSVRCTAVDDRNRIEQVSKTHGSSSRLQSVCWSATTGCLDGWATRKNV